jgi:hypothetical protein
MRVICIRTSSSYGKLIIDKIYEVLYEATLWYEIIDDNGYLSYFPKDLFIILADFRQSQIDSILY